MWYVADCLTSCVTFDDHSSAVNGEEAEVTKPIASMSSLPPSSPPSSSDGGNESLEGDSYSRYTVPQRLQNGYPKHKSHKGFAARGHVRRLVLAHTFRICPAYSLIHVRQESLGSVPEVWQSHVQRSAVRPFAKPG